MRPSSIMPSFSSASLLAEQIRNRQYSVSYLADLYLSRIHRYNAQLNAVVTCDPFAVRAAAADMDQRLAAGEEPGPLFGVPITVKDSFATAGMRTTSSHPPLKDYVPQHDATAVARLRQAGALILGKTNLPELAGDPQCWSPVFGRANNPWDLDCTPGGSTGGGAAATAAGLSALDLGSDSGGSIRLPAHFCGVYGLKPSENRVPCTGHIPDLPDRPRLIRHACCFGPLARSIEDLRLVLALLAGPDGIDCEVPPVPPAALPPRKPLQQLRIAVWDDFGVPLASDVRRVLQETGAALRDAGCEITRARPAGFDPLLALQAYGTLLGNEAGQGVSWPARMLLPLMRPLLHRHDHIGRAFARGLHFDARDLSWALQQRDELLRCLEPFLQQYDAWLVPVSATAAFEHVPVHPSRPPPLLSVDGEPVPYFTATIALTAIFSLLGVPVVSLPAGRSSAGLPIGVQLVGRKWRDEALLDVAATLDEVLPGFAAPPGFCVNLDR